MIKSYEWMLARRYLKSRRDERFVSLIGWSSAIGVAIGVAALIVVMSVMYGFDAELKNKILGFSSHVDIQGADDTLENWQKWLEISENIEGVAKAAPYITAQVLANNGRYSTGVILKGVDVTREENIASHIISGRFISDQGHSPYEIVIGKDLARKLHVSVGGSLRLISPAGGISPAGMVPRVRGFRVVGIFDSGFYEYDVGLMIAPLVAVQRLNRMGDRVTGIELHLYDRNQASVVAARARMQLPVSAWVTDWMHRHRSFFQALKMERLVMGIILSLIVLVAVFNMVSSLVMVVMERRKEIAILKTVGATHASVMRIFLMMGTLLCGLGTLLGASFGLLLAWQLDALLGWIEKITGITILSGDVYFIEHVPSLIDPVSVAWIVIVSLLLGVLATFYPAWRAANVPPADALRYE
ncbi:MAG: lipoprotein-releasing ABC transporter permease subunit [Mariprofundaceae bacterium]|nr:lipoprotein-releasing ABC transporter permease subunit [Mariprofundaceae bacterium]